MNRILNPLCVVLAAAAILVSLTAMAFTDEPPGKQPNPLTVVELYTSQGCSSCPPADRVLGELAGRDDVLALSFHVDYWDYIGWRDPFADPAHTMRQRRYAKQLSLRYIYTPQAIIQGSHQLTGSDKAGILRHIKTVDPEPKLTIALHHEADGWLTVTLPGQGDLLSPGGGSAEAAVYLVGFDALQTTEIKRGENRGQTLTHHNVVRHYDRIGLWDGKAATLRVPLAALAGRSGCAVLVQSIRTGAILGAVRMAL